MQPPEKVRVVGTGRQDKPEMKDTSFKRKEGRRRTENHLILIKDKEGNLQDKAASSHTLHMGVRPTKMATVQESASKGRANFHKRRHLKN